MARSWYSLAGYPPSIQSLHVDRIGFDAALFKSATADRHCGYMEQRAVGLVYDGARDRIYGVQLARGQTIESSYVFDATNHIQLCRLQLGLRRTRLGTAQRVVFRRMGS